MNPILTQISSLLGLRQRALVVSDEEVRVFEISTFLNLVRPRSSRTQKIKNRDAASAIRAVLKNRDDVPVTVFLNGSRVVPLFLSIPKMPSNRLRSVIAEEIEKNLPVKMDTISYTYTVLSDIREKGSGMIRTNILAACIRKTDLDDVVSVLRQMDANTKAVVYSPLSPLASVKNRLLSGVAGVVLLSENHACLTAVNDGKPSGFTVLNGNWTKPGPVLTRNLERYFTDVFREREMKPDRLIIIPLSGSPISPSIVKSLSELTGYETTSPRENDFRGGRKGMSDPMVFGHFYGGKSGHSTGFVSPSPVKKAVDLSLRIFLWFLLVLSFGALAALPSRIATLIGHAEIRRILAMKPEEIAKQSDRELRERLLSIRERNELRGKMTALENRIAELSRQPGADRTPWTLATLTEISRLVPADSRLTALVIREGKGELHGSSLNSESMEKFIGGISGSRMFRKVSLIKAELSRNEAGGVDFQLAFELNRAGGR